MVKNKANQKIHIDKLKTTLDKLGQLKEKPKEELTLRESIYFLRDKLKSALKKGYSYQDLSEILEEQQILVSASTLKQYLTEINKESAAKRKRSKSGQAKTTKSNVKEDKDKSVSKSQSDTDLSKDVNTSKEKSDTDLSSVESDTVKEASKSDTKQESVSSRSKSRTSSKTKAKKISGSNQDLSSDFNQY